MKQLKVWGTDWYRRYKRDIFLSTRIKIILFQTASVVVIVTITAVLIEYIRRITLQTVAGSLKSMLEGDSLTQDSFVATNQTIDTAQIFVFIAIFLVVLFTGLIGTRLALRPVKQALIMQKRFIASVAHELRTPLAILKTENEVARLDAPTNTPHLETLDQNVVEIDHITEILNNLLLFNRVDTQEGITFETVDLTEIIEKVMERLHDLAQKKGIVLHFERTTIPHVHGNVIALEQVFFNLVKNGLSYSSKGCEVRIACTSIMERQVTLSVTDDGVGIAKQDLPHIFEPFFRSKNGEKMERGTGLGLAIVFEIIKLHKGKIRVESTEGQGTRFDVTLPREPDFLDLSKGSHDPGITFDFSKKKNTK